MGTTAGTIAAGDDPRFSAIGDVSGKVDRADPQMAAPPFVTFPVPALVTSVPQNAIDQNGVLCLGHIGADLTGTSAVDNIMQRAMDAIGKRIANSAPPGSPVGGGRRYGSVLKFPMGSRCRFQTGVAFHDGPVSVIGGTGLQRDANLGQERRPRSANAHADPSDQRVRCRSRTGRAKRFADRVMLSRAARDQSSASGS